MSEASRDGIRSRLTSVFRDVFDDDEIEIFDAMSADDVEAWDSLSHITLVVAIEKTFGVRLNPAEVAKLENVGEIIDLVVQRSRTA
jgi:acyl carrier protein